MPPLRTTSLPPPRSGPPPETTRSNLPRTGPRGLLSILFLNPGRAAGVSAVLSVGMSALWVAALLLGWSPGVRLVLAAIVLPVAVLVLPVAGILESQQLPVDYRQLEPRMQFGLWLRGRRVRGWPLPAGALADASVRRHAGLIVARSGRITRLARGARAALAAQVATALQGVRDGHQAEAVIDETIVRVERWEASAAGMPPVGAKLYLRHDPLSPRAARAAATAARLGVVSDKLNYFWRGQVLLLPPVRSHQTLAALTDALLDAGVANRGRPLPFQITVQGGLGDGAKFIPLAQLLASGLDMSITGPERRGDEGNIIARGRFRPERVAGEPGDERTDFLFSLIWATVADVAGEGYAEQHCRDLRVAQTLSAALLAQRRHRLTRDPADRRLAASWRLFGREVRALCDQAGVPEAARQQYTGRPFVAVRPALERLLERKAASPMLRDSARRVRDRALALVEFELAVARLLADEPASVLRLGFADGAAESLPLARGLRAARRRIWRGARPSVVTASTGTLTVLLEHPPL